MSWTIMRIQRVARDKARLAKLDADGFFASFQILHIPYSSPDLIGKIESFGKIQ